MDDGCTRETRPFRDCLNDPDDNYMRGRASGIRRKVIQSNAHACAVMNRVRQAVRHVDDLGLKGIKLLGRDLNQIRLYCYSYTDRWERYFWYEWAGTTEREIRDLANILYKREFEIEFQSRMRRIVDGWAWFMSKNRKAQLAGWLLDAIKGHPELNNKLLGITQGELKELVRQGA